MYSIFNFLIKTLFLIFFNTFCNWLVFYSQTTITVGHIYWERNLTFMKYKNLQLETLKCSKINSSNILSLFLIKVMHEIWWRCCLLAKLCLTGLWHHELYLCRLLSMEFSSQEYWIGCHFLHQGIFLTQGLNPCLLLWRLILNQWVTWGAPA